jgi:hypothetical protein
VAYGLPKEAPGAAYPRSGVAMGVGVVCESERTGKTEAKTRVEWSIAEVLRSPALRRCTYEWLAAGVLVLKGARSTGKT